MNDFAEFKAPASWRLVEFISDLHLQIGEPATFKAWRSYLQNTEADAVFILGDLFEVWVGDDIANPPAPASLADSCIAPAGEFERQCADVLRAASEHTRVFFMRGNRDFLVGEAFLARCGTQLLADPTVLVFGGQRWLLSHGDELCLDDTAYQQFRALVRSSAWQSDFLGKPLQERIDLARGLRAQSQARQKSGNPFVDVDAAAAAQWLAQARAQTLIHGHTHRPARHVLPAATGDHAPDPSLERVVLSDWDAAAVPPRLEVLRLTQNPAMTQLNRISLKPV